MKRSISHSIGATVIAVVLSVASIGISVNAAGASTVALPTISLAMDGSSITVGGTLQSGATQIESTVTQVPFADPTLIRLNTGVTADDVFAALATPELQDADNVVHYGSIVMDTEVEQGTSDIETTLQPGDYIAFDSKKGDQTKWPHATFSITESAQPASLPPASATVSAVEFGFRGPNALHDGQIVRFQNDGFLVHMIVGLRARNAADARQIAEFLLAGKDAKANHLVVGFAGFMFPVSNGAVQQQVLDVKPGRYVLACFMETQDGREHTQLGMVRVVKVIAAA